MKKIVTAAASLLFMLSFHVQATVISVATGGSQVDIDGTLYYDWSDGANWSSGSVPGTGDDIQFLTPNYYLYLDQSRTANSLRAMRANGNLHDNNQNRTLTVGLTYFSNELILHGTVRVAGATAFQTANTAPTISLSTYDNSYIELGSTLNFNDTTSGTLFTFSAYNNSEIRFADELGNLTKLANVAAGSSFVAVDNSILTFLQTDAQELNDSFLANNTSIYLSDNATLQLASGVDLLSMANKDSIFINGVALSSANSSDYEWNTATGTLTLIPEPSTIGLFIVSGAGCIILRRRVLS
ncbi:MAG: PEP-CTERM sorting domain-containing protein [Kiritimatiellales bacterium]